MKLRKLANRILSLCYVNAGTTPTYQDGQYAPLSVNANGELQVSGTFTTGFTFLGNNGDGIAPVAAAENGATNAYLYGYQEGSNSFDRVRVAGSDNDNRNVSTTGVVLSRAYNYLYRGDGAFDRAYSSTNANMQAWSGKGGQIVTAPGQFSNNHTPAANTQAIITSAAQPNIARVITGIQASYMVGAAGVSARTDVVIRNGPSGVGTIIGRWAVSVDGMLPGSIARLDLTGLSITTAVNTITTIEFTAAGGVDTYEVISNQGYFITTL